MTLAIDPELLARFSTVVTERTGLSFPRDRWGDLERGITSAAKEFGLRKPEEVIGWFLSSHPDAKSTEILASHLTVGETFFFRDARSFQALEEHVLPALIASRRQDRRLRIWSAGCCTGEEPYSLAILLQSLLPDIREWTITLLATDINPRFLLKATEGVYGEWSFRDTPAWVKERCFIRRKVGQYQIHDSARSMVTFVPLNLIDDSYPSFVTNTNAMDLILCRNVLMYFLPEHAKSVVNKLSRSLVPSGWLLVSPSEMSHVLFPDFEPVQLSGTLCYRKNPQPPQVVSPHSPPAQLPHVASLGHDANNVSETPEIPPSVEEVLVGESDRQAAETPEGVQPDEGYHEAVRLYAGGNFAGALERVRSGLLEHPDDAPHLALFARILASQGDLAGAEEHCLKAIAADKLNAVYRYFYAVILHEQGRDDDAVTSLQRAIYADSEFPLSHFLLGHLADRKGKPHEAKKHFHQTLRLLARYRQDDVLPESEGMTAGRLREVITSIVEQEAEL